MVSKRQLRAAIMAQNEVLLVVVDLLERQDNEIRLMREVLKRHLTLGHKPGDEVSGSEARDRIATTEIECDCEVCKPGTGGEAEVV